MTQSGHAAEVLPEHRPHLGGELAAHTIAEEPGQLTAGEIDSSTLPMKVPTRFSIFRSGFTIVLSSRSLAATSCSTRRLTTRRHPSDVDKLVAQLDRLVATGDTVMVVEHDIARGAGSDRVIDVARRRDVNVAW